MWFIYYYMFKFQMEISIIDSIKLPFVSVSKKNGTYRAFPDRSLNSLRPGDILKIMHSNLFSSSMYVKTFIEMSHKGPYWVEVNIGSGNGLAPSDNKPLHDPSLTRFMTPYGQKLQFYQGNKPDLFKSPLISWQLLNTLRRNRAT